MQRLDLGARVGILVDAAQAIFKQRALEVMARGGIGVLGMHVGQRGIHLVVERQLGGDAGNLFVQRLALVAQRGIAAHGKHHVGFIGRNVEVVIGIVVGTQRIGHRVFALFLDDAVDMLLCRCQMQVDPGFQLRRIAAAGPGVQRIVFRRAGGGRCCCRRRGGHGRQRQQHGQGHRTGRQARWDDGSGFVHTHSPKGVSIS